MNPRWLALTRNAPWIAVPLIALLMFGTRTTTEATYMLLWLAPFVGAVVFWIKYVLWQQRRDETPEARAFRETEGASARWQTRGQTIPEWCAMLLVFLWWCGKLALGVGLIYVALHFLMKYW